MSNRNLSHEEIAQRFVDSKAVDFHALGKLIAELGPTLAVSDHGIHGVAFGKHSIIACMMPAADVGNLVGNVLKSGLAASIAEAAGENTPAAK